MAKFAVSAGLLKLADPVQLKGIWVQVQAAAEHGHTRVGEVRKDGVMEL